MRREPPHCNAQCSQLHSHYSQNVGPLHTAITMSRNPPQCLGTQDKPSVTRFAPSCLHVEISASPVPCSNTLCHFLPSSQAISASPVPSSNTLCPFLPLTQEISASLVSCSNTLCPFLPSCQDTSASQVPCSNTLCPFLPSFQDASASQVPCSKSRDAALAGMAVKVMQLESLVSSKQAELQRMGDTGQAWIEEACCLRDAVASTLAALGQLPSLLCHVNCLLELCVLCCKHYSRLLKAPNEMK